MKNKLVDIEGITAVILSFIGGILDVYCLYNFGIYGMLHTGNVIKLITYLIDLDIGMFLATLFIILSFSIGIFLANLYSRFRKSKSASGLLLITIILLIFIICVPNDKEAGTLSYIKYLSAVLFGLEGAFILHSFVKFGDYSYSATTMTANISRFVSIYLKELSIRIKPKVIVF